MAVAIDEISTMTLPNYSGLGVAIEGLTAKQAALVLSTRNLSQAELEEVVIQNNLISKYGAEQLVKTGLLSANSSLLVSEKTVSVEKLKESILQSALNKEKATEFIQTQLSIVSDGEETVSTIILNQALMKEAIRRGVLTKEKAYDILSTYGVITADKLEIGSKKGLIKTIGKLISANASLIASIAGITALVIIMHQLSKVVEKVRNKAQELGDSFKETYSTIDEYKSKIKELYKVINDESSSIEDTTNARKSLLSIQGELIDKFGTEESVINDVTDAINGQTDALDKLSKAKWQKTKNDFTHGGFWNYVANFLQGTDNIERMLDEYGEKTISIRWADYADINKLTDEMVAKLENIGVDINVSTDNLQAIRDFDSLTESIEDTKGARLSLSGNAEEIYNKLLALQNLIGNDDSLDKLYDKVGNVANSYKELTEKYKNFYDQYILQEKIFTDDSKYADTFKNIIDAAEKYNEAFTSGDETKIKEAADEYASLVSNAMATAIANGDSDVATYFENMYPTLKSIVDSWKFNIAFDENTDNLQGKVQSVLYELKDKDGRSLTAQEILGLDETNKQYQDLVSIAHSYNMSIDEMIELLKERNLIAAMDYQGLVGLFGQENVDKLSPEDIEIAYQIKNVSNMTFDELQAEIEKAKEIAEEPISALSISDTVTQLNTRLKPASDSLKSAYNDIFTDDGFTLNSIDILSTCDAIKSKLDEMSDPEGLNLDVDYSAFEDFVRVLNNTESTEYDVEKAFDSLATSITHAALTGKEDFDTMKAVLEDLGVTNNEIVAFDALASNTEALKEAGLDLANATEEQVTAFAEAMVSAENYGQAINLLRIQKILCKESPLSTAEDINELYRLAQAAGISANAIQQLMGLNSAYVIAAESGNTIAMTAVKVQMDMARKQVLGQFAGLRTDVDFSEIGGGVSKAKSAGEAAGKSYADALKDELSNLNSAISYIGGVIGDQIDLFQEQKDAAVDALEAEKEAAEEALEAEKELVQEKIDAKQAEIDAIEDAAKARKNELDLQKAQYDLERMQNQKTMLAYSESKGMHYVADTKEIRQAKEAATEAKENIQVANMEKDIAGLNDTIEGLDKKIGESNEYYGKLIEETGKYWDSLIKGLEEYKSRWQELADIEEQAKMEAMLRNLGITTEDILSMSGSAFGSFKDTYLGLLSEMYAGNGEMSKMLQEFGGISTGTLGPLPGALDAVAGSLGRLSASAGDAGANTSTVSGNMGALSTSAAGLNDNLPGVASTLNDILEDNKLETAAGQLREVAGAIQSVSDALGGMPTGMDISGVAGQFDALGSSVGRASASISGGDAPKAGPPGGAPGNNATNAQGGAYSLVGSIKGLKSEADKSVGTNENSGIIGQFNRLGASVARVSAAVGGRAAEPGGNAGDGGKGPGSLISSVTALGPAAGETLGEPDGEGVAGRFGQLATTIAGAEGHVAGIISKLDELGKMPPAECTIVVNVETRGGLPGGTPANPVSDAIGALGKAGGQHTTKHKGKAYAQGTALVAGDWEAQSAGGKALVGEAGYEIVVRGGRFFTVGDRGPEMFPIQKGDIVFNHRQSVELLERGHTTGRGKAYADGTVGGGKSLTPDGAILEPYDPATDASSFGIFVRKFNNYLESIDHNVSKLATSAMYENGRQIQEAANQINSSTNINNTRNQPTINVGGISITCPGVTSQEVMKNVGIALDEKFRGFSNYADQQSRIRR